MKSLLLHLGMPHSGTQFLRALVTSHKCITPALTARQLCLAQAKNCLGPRWRNPDYHSPATVLDALIKEYGQEYCFYQLGIYTHEESWLPLFFNNEVPTKIIMPLRSPLNVMLSHYKRGPGHEGPETQVMGRYRLLIELFHVLDICVVPVDIYEGMAAQERSFAIRDTFASFLNLPDDEVFEEHVLKWIPARKIGPTYPYTDHQMREMRLRIRNAGIYERLLEVGISCYQAEAEAE